MKRKKSPERAVSELQELCGDPCEVELTERGSDKVLHTDLGGSAVDRTTVS